MSEFKLTRVQVEKELEKITKKTKDQGLVKTEMEAWLKKKQCSEFETTQILNDLTSYSQYLELN